MTYVAEVLADSPAVYCRNNPANTTVIGANALNSAVINVGSTTGFPASGTAVINGIDVTYTGVTGTSLTGCGAHAAYAGGEVAYTKVLDDISTNNLDGTWNNAPTIGVAGPIASDPADSAMSFASASSQFGNVPYNALLNDNDILTQEAWIKTPNASVGIMSRGQGDAYLRVNTAGKLELVRSNIAIIVASTITVNDNSWHHVVMTKNAAAVKLYIDGVDRTGVVTNSALVNNSGDGLQIGCDINSAHVRAELMNGSIDEVAFYTTALSAARVLAHYNAAALAVVHTGPFTAKTEMDAEVLSEIVVAGGQSNSIAIRIAIGI